MPFLQFWHPTTRVWANQTYVLQKNAMLLFSVINVLYLAFPLYQRHRVLSASFFVSKWNMSKNYFTQKIKIITAQRRSSLAIMECLKPVGQIVASKKNNNILYVKFETRKIKNYSFFFVFAYELYAFFFFNTTKWKLQPFFNFILLRTLEH